MPLADVDSRLFCVLEKICAFRTGVEGSGGERRISPSFILKRVVFTKSVAVNDVIVIYQPGIDGDEVGDKTGNAALEHGAIPADDMFQVDIRLVRLMHHYIIAIDH